MIAQAPEVLPDNRHFYARHRARLVGIAVLFALLLLAAYFAIMSGNFPIPFSALLQSWLRAGPLPTELSTPAYIVSQLRLPRVLLAGLIGAMLGMSGCAMQGLVRNPLADPGLIGISGGAAAAATLSMAVFPPAMAELAPYWVTIWAFGGALAAVWLVIRLANTPAGLSVATLILAGVAINALTGTVIGAVSYVASDDALRQISYWTMGSLAGANWSTLTIINPRSA
ncbi:iron ABC transporter permease [Alteromonas pelagimontana]|uniref:Iron ABC transporter permease n=1 Tax=Alteromonas pelagimontana TaxID=1858656 RepID=A0A6M4MDJ6_9ALTE|nr:iron ABC transporter permease [Alteromonas pelagimontana]